MKHTENYEQLLERFTKRYDQMKAKQDPITEGCPAWIELNDQLHYLRGCKDTIVYLMTGKLPNDGNHDGMKNHKPRENQ
tara:strand:- start:191 stop:427 length:237 start_codon:yes stop_codon:yes gene_type:complete